MANDIIIDAPVDWTGENPGVYLKDDAAGPWVTLASFFRVFVSPKGPGTALLLLASPGDAFGTDAAPNVCITDNEPLARWLISDFASNFGFFRPKIPMALAALARAGCRHSRPTCAVKSCSRVASALLAAHEPTQKIGPESHGTKG